MNEIFRLSLLNTVSLSESVCPSFLYSPLCLSFSLCRFPPLQKAGANKTAGQIHLGTDSTAAAGSGRLKAEVPDCQHLQRVVETRFRQHRGGHVEKSPSVFGNVTLATGA